jgi:hypothetical protein
MLHYVGGAKVSLEQVIAEFMNELTQNIEQWKNQTLLYVLIGFAHYSNSNEENDLNSMT